MSKRTTLLLLVGIMLLGGFLRFYRLNEVPIGLYPDEAMNGSNALEALETGAFKIFYPENNGREGLFINIQALAVWTFGNEPWALRVVSAIFGTLTILGVYLVARELFFKKGEANASIIGLLSAFFLATSYWHLNFSRIGFRAITLPFFASLGLYFLLKSLRKGTIWDMVWAGILTGLGFQTYIAYRFMPFILAVPLLGALWKWLRGKTEAGAKCVPCAVALFVFVTFITALPIGIYFVQHPEDFVGRSAQVSIFAMEHPLREFVRTNLLTTGMLFVRGDCNWRHNYNCQPELNPIVAVFFAAGLILTFLSIIKNPKTGRFSHLDFGLDLKFGFWILLTWLFFMSIPATLTHEGMPHALRAIGMIPPVVIIAGFGAWWIIHWLLACFEREKERWQEYRVQLGRIQRELMAAFIILLLVVPLLTFNAYFRHWAFADETYGAFATDVLHMAQYLRTIPDDVKKYVLVNAGGVDVRGIPMPVQPIMFLTDSFTARAQNEKNITYVTAVEDIPRQANDGNALILVMNFFDRSAFAAITERFPRMKGTAPGDFTVFMVQ